MRNELLKDKSIVLTGMNYLATKFKEALSDGNKLNDCSDILKKYKDRDWVNEVKYNTDKYNRILIGQNEYVDVMLLCWGTNQNSGIHDHPNDGCLLKVLDGCLTEHKYTLKNGIPVETSKRTLNVDGISYMKGGQLHDIHPEEGAVSIHIYSPSGYHPNFY